MGESTAPGRPILLIVKRFSAAVSILALATAPALAAPTPSPRPVIPKVVYLKYRVAPADEYFGRLKLSILGVRNTLRDLGARAAADPAHATAVLGPAGLTEDAIRDWEAKYPHDTWIPPALLSLERVYARVDSDDARARAQAVMARLVHDYPTSTEGKLGKSELALGLVGAKPTPPPAPPPDPVVASPAVQTPNPLPT
jgi:hypothetical protein